MSKVLITDTHLSDIADAIRNKNGSTTTYTPGQMAAAINAIPTGGGGGSVTLQDKTYTPSETGATITYDNGYDGLRKVTVAGITSTYVGSGVTKQGAQTITPSTSNQTIAANTYLTGVQTIQGDSDLVASNIKHDVSIFNVTGTFGAKIGIITSTPSSRSSTITFTGLQGTPLAFVCYMSAQGTISKSYRTCSPVVYDGSTVRNTTSAISGSSLVTYTYTNCTYTYSNGSLTITSPSTGTNGFFQAMQHYLVYVYEE